MIKIYPSIFSGPGNNVTKKEVIELENYCYGFHLDIMDNKFVPNSGLTIESVNKISKLTQKELWVHLMVEDPIYYISNLTLKDNDIVSIHLEIKKDIEEILNFLKDKKLQPSIAIKPNTPISALDKYLDRVDQVLIMSVEPGFSGQNFIENSIKKIEEIKKLKIKNNLKFTIGVDGGIKYNNLKAVIDAGSEDIVIGSYIFKDNDPVEKLKKINSLI